MKQWLKNHKKDFIMWGLVLLIFVITFLIIYYENKDKEHYHNVSCNSDINIVNDDINLNRNILYGGVQITTTTNVNITYSQFDDYLKLSDFNYDGQAFSSGDVTIYITRFNLNSIKNNLLSYNNNNYSVDISTTSMTLEFSYESYQNNQEYGVIYYQYNNNSVVDYAMPLKNNTSLFARNLVDSNANFRYSDRMQLDFNYDYLDFCYYIIYNDQGDELITGYQNYMYFNDNISFYSQQLQNQNNALQDTINNLENQNNSLQFQYDSLDTNYQNLLNQYNTLLNSTEYSFSELFWSISAVPFGVLTSAFNVNVLGVNLAGIVTGLFTAMLLIWLFKKFFK